jgi:hypothetical protein
MGGTPCGVGQSDAAQDDGGGELLERHEASFTAKACTATACFRAMTGRSGVERQSKKISHAVSSRTTKILTGARAPEDAARTAAQDIAASGFALDLFVATDSAWMPRPPALAMFTP